MVTIVRFLALTTSLSYDRRDGLDGFAIHLTARELRAASGIHDITGDRDASSSRSSAPRLSADRGLGRLNIRVDNDLKVLPVNNIIVGHHQNLAFKLEDCQFLRGLSRGLTGETVKRSPSRSA